MAWLGTRWNPTARRFLQMDSGIRMEGGPANMAANAYSDGHHWGAWERFRVVDAGDGRIALHNYKHLARPLRYLMFPFS